MNIYCNCNPTCKYICKQKCLVCHSLKNNDCCCKNMNSYSLQKNTFSKDCLDDNLAIIEGTLEKIKISIFKYVASISHLIDYASNMFDRSINKIPLILNRYNEIQNNITNEIIFHCKNELTTNVNSINLIVTRDNSKLSCQYLYPKDINIETSSGDKLFLIYIPCIRINIDKNNFFFLQVINNKKENSSYSSKVKTYKKRYFLSPKVCDIKNYFYRNKAGEIVYKCEADTQTSFNILLDYFNTIINVNPEHNNLYHYPKMDIDNLISYIDLLIEEIRLVKKSPMFM